MMLHATNRTVMSDEDARQAEMPMILTMRDHPLIVLPGIALPAAERFVTAYRPSTSKTNQAVTSQRGILRLERGRP